MHKSQLLVAGVVNQVIPSRNAATLLGTERWIGKYQCSQRQLLAFITERIAIENTSILVINGEVMQHEVHHRQAPSVRHKLHAKKCTVLVFVVGYLVQFLNIVVAINVMVSTY
ncbi:hypothetical protein D3C78_1253800 [compost metagenome]